jgi:hypothetical protein
MDDGQQRPRDAIGAICADAGAKIGADPMQLDLWSALQPRYDTFEAAADQHPRAFISKIQPTRAPAQGSEPRPLLIDPLGAPQVDSSIDHGITPPVRDDLIASTPSVNGWFHPALVTGALVVAIGVGWLGGASPSFFFAPTAAPVQQANSSGCAREPGKDTACDSVKTDREATSGAPAPAKLATPAAGANPNRAREPSRGMQQASASTNKDVSTTNSIATTGSTQERAKVLPRPAPVPETRPSTIEGWSIREVVGGTVVLEGPGGVWRAAQGDTVPGVGRIESVVRWGSRWIVATSKGLISTQN